MPATPLPPPRRILTATAPNGDSVVLDDTTPFANDDEQLKGFVGFVQPDLIGKADQAFKYAEYKPTKISHDDQVSLRWVDVPPRYIGAQHYTNTFDYMIITHGTLELVLPDGQTKIVNVGDAVVQAANIHAWNNKTDEWASKYQFFCGYDV
uniref:Cupin 2 conserved barrel domain-containing protein n=1 Tax=Kwoniella bestiolae CBS 10118 TaxID=1296100 RepID=A0A1B9GF98_9TREE|nr:hypothetical protein I302_01240 [Kwoniella bestiolae CBS 10118]OCF29727.1 hypothetical protein I302_01240 [Kwoniella bestiolae CBS 10118]